MDPLRGVIHLGLKLTETTLDRAVEVVRLADAVLVASAVPPVREPASETPVWPEEEQADLDALSATLRARDGSESTSARRAAATKATQETTSASAAPAKRAAPKKSAATKTSPGKKTTAKKATKAASSGTQKKAPARKAPTKKAPAKKAATKQAPAKKTASTRTTPRKAAR